MDEMEETMTNDKAIHCMTTAQGHQKLNKSVTTYPQNFGMKRTISVSISFRSGGCFGHKQEVLELCDWTWDPILSLATPHCYPCIYITTNLRVSKTPPVSVLSSSQNHDQTCVRSQRWLFHHSRKDNPDSPLSVRPTRLRQSKSSLELSLRLPLIMLFYWERASWYKRRQSKIELFSYCMHTSKFDDCFPYRKLPSNAAGTDRGNAFLVGISVT